MPNPSARLPLFRLAEVRAEWVPVDLLDAVAGLQPGLDRLREGDWRVLILGARCAADRRAAAAFQAALLNLSDVLEARR